MTQDPNIPDDWTPLGDIEATSTNADGGVFIDASSRDSIIVIQYHEDRENDVIRMFNSEAVQLAQSLLEQFSLTREIDR